jgi:hypothetical protein
VATARSASLEIITNDDAVVLLDLQSYVRLSSRELNAALQRLGSGTDWHVVFHIFDHLCLAQHITTKCSCGNNSAIHRWKTRGS